MATPAADVRAHRRRRFTGRDPDEGGRAATPLELLYDLTIVVAFGTAADELAHFVAEDHIAAGVAGFAFAVFAVAWAWLNYSWFASAYDTDDWVFRLATMVQMVGVIVLALGLPQMFASIDHGDTLDNGVMVAGYVVMRVALHVPVVAGRPPRPAARAGGAHVHDRRSASRRSAGWRSRSSPADRPTLAGVAVLVAHRAGGPVLAERKGEDALARRSTSPSATACW